MTPEALRFLRRLDAVDLIIQHTERRLAAKECIACGAKPPHGHVESYAGHRDGCSLVAVWRKHATSCEAKR